jgi:hypothetical protein
VLLDRRTRREKYPLAGEGEERRKTRREERRERRERREGRRQERDRQSEQSREEIEREADMKRKRGGVSREGGKGENRPFWFWV